MIVVFFVVVLLLILFIGFVEYNSYSIKKQAFKLEFSGIEHLLGIVPVLPEFACSKFGVVEDCMDTSKFNELDVDYFGRNLVIEVEEILLIGDIWVLYNSTSGDYDEVYKVSTFVSLYYPEDKYYGVGVLKLEWYQ